MEIQIGDFAGIQLEFLELVDGIVLAVVLLSVDIEYPILVLIVRPVGSGDAPGQAVRGWLAKLALRQAARILRLRSSCFTALYVFLCLFLYKALMAALL